MKVVGLMSGTSADGIDAALVDIRKRGSRIATKLLAFTSSPYTKKLQSQVLDLCSSGTGPEVCDLNVVLGERFAAAAFKVIASSSYAVKDIDLIGSHGQTLYHQTRGRFRSTLQIGEPSIIAERTGITTVADFRPRDMAAGGEGAPLTPYAHQLLFQHKTKSRLIVNLGGICNVTYLPSNATQGDIIACDVGPGNMMIDRAIAHLTHGKAAQDTGGASAAKGQTNRDMLAVLMQHPFLKRRPPKSTGGEEFGNEYVQRMLRHAGRLKLNKNDILATLTTFTALSAKKCERFLNGPIDELILAGGGTRNRALVRALQDAFQPIPVTTTESYGWNSKAIEAAAFAILAFQTVRGTPNNLPSVTGAQHPVVLGKIVPGQAMRHSSFRV